MKWKNLTFRITSLMLILFCGVALYNCASQGQREHIVVVSTNDIHAAFEKMPQLVTLVNNLREEYDNVLVFDAGDRTTGNPYVDKATRRGEPLYELMNMVDYDYGVLGNHEFDYGQEGLLSCLELFEAEIVCANTDFEQAQVPIKERVKPYRIFEVGGVRAAILGLIQIDDLGIPSSMPSNMEGIKFSNGVERSLEYKFLRDSAEIVIALTHLGFEDDSLMVCKNNMFDLVVGGHSHTYLPRGKVINGTLVTQTGSKLTGVGVTHIVVEDGKLISVNNQIVSLEGIEPNPEALAYVEACKEGSPLNVTIGTLDVDLTRVGLINMCTDIIRERSGVDIVLQNTGSIRIDGLPTGEVTAAQIYELEPFGNHIVTQDMMLDDIKTMILTKFNGGGGESRQIDLSASGMIYEIIVDESGKGAEVVCYDLKGRAMNNRRLTMATSNYVSSAYIYPGQGQATPLDEGEVVIADAVIDVFERGDTYVGDNDPRVFIKER
ncbi:MAG: bifunctional UDP-sugar hydrolase/5'-nucleotidase [Rikenellaceae bacterium]